MANTKGASLVMRIGTNIEWQAAVQALTCPEVLHNGARITVYAQLPGTYPPVQVLAQATPAGEYVSMRTSKFPGMVFAEEALNGFLSGDDFGHIYSLQSVQP
jgi:hypothetical protein